MPAERMKRIHGGDWVGYQAEYGSEPLDFSASISPLGLPEGVRRAAEEALKKADRYPDPLCRQLRTALAEYHGVSMEQIVCGNGASDLIDRICRVLRPKNAAVLTPCFAEYAAALKAEDCSITEVPLPEGKNFLTDEAALRAIPENCELLFLCNPNNPTGLLAGENAVRRLLERCRETGMHLVTDECFLDFTQVPEQHSLVSALETTPELVVLRAFTKTWAMAGLRLGYALCGSELLARTLQNSGPPWPVSTVAQAAGVAALREQDYLCKVRELVTAERKRMIPELEALGLRVIPGEANFLLFHSGDEDLCAKLREKGILIRDCRNFSGLRAGWYRIAIRTAEDNSRLLQALGEVL